MLLLALALGLAACSDDPETADTRFTVSEYDGRHLVRTLHFDCEEDSESCDLADLITQIRDEPQRSCPVVRGGAGRLLISGLLSGRTLLMEVDRRDACGVRNFNRLRTAADEAVQKPYVAPADPAATSTVGP